MALARLPQAKKGAEIDLSLAIVNIVLLLILFFLIAGQLVTIQEFKVDPAVTRKLAVEILPSPVLIHLGPGQWELDEAPIALSELSTALADAKVVHILADQSAAALEIVELTMAPELAHLELRLVTVRSAEQ